MIPCRICATRCPTTRTSCTIISFHAASFVSFVDGMRKVLTDNKTNLLNASVRIVHQENNFLTYSPEPAFSLVLYINQTTDDEGNRRMKKATEELIDLTIAHKGGSSCPTSSIIRATSCSVLSADQRFLRGEAQIRSGETVHQHVLSEVRVVRALIRAAWRTRFWRQAAAAAGLLGVQHQQRARRIEAGDEAGIVGARDGDVVVRAQHAAVGLGDRGQRLRRADDGHRLAGRRSEGQGDTTASQPPRRARSRRDPASGRSRSDARQ
jgi:hypothetical protein